jgi:hypothetical protein
VVEEDLLLLARKAYMYSIPAATLSSGVSLRSTVEDEDDDDATLAGELWREVLVEEEVYGGGGVVGLLNGLLKMTPWLEVCGGGEAASLAEWRWGSCVCCSFSGCECGRRGFACAMSAQMGP